MTESNLHEGRQAGRDESPLGADMDLAHMRPDNAVRTRLDSHRAALQVKAIIKSLVERDIQRHRIADEYLEAISPLETDSAA